MGADHAAGAPTAQTLHGHRRSDASARTTARASPSLGFDTRTHEFTGTLPELLRLGVRAVQSCGWTVTDADDTVGLLTFETKMSWGSWSGITATLSFAETSPYRWRVNGTGKQNVRGHQLAAVRPSVTRLKLVDGWRGAGSRRLSWSR